MNTLHWKAIAAQNFWLKSFELKFFTANHSINYKSQMMSLTRHPPRVLYKVCSEQPNFSKVALVGRLTRPFYGRFCNQFEQIWINLNKKKTKIKSRLWAKNEIYLTLCSYSLISLWVSSRNSLEEKDRRLLKKNFGIRSPNRCAISGHCGLLNSLEEEKLSGGRLSVKVLSNSPLTWSSSPSESHLREFKP